MAYSAATFATRTSVQNAPVSAVNATVEYCREARRLRARWSGDASELQARLRVLAMRRDAASAKTAEPTVRRVAPIPTRPDLDVPNHNVSRRVIDQFIDLSLAAIDGPILRYSQRESLLRVAGRLGISRFHANLIIASLLYQQGGHSSPAGNGTEWIEPIPARFAVFVWASLIVLAEFTAVAIAWRHLAT